MNGIAVKAFYSEENVNEIFLPLLEKTAALRREKGRRVLVFLAAPPGAGKSTLCEFLKYLSDERGFPPLTAIGMDGFHHYRGYLASHKTVRDGRETTLSDIKGAPVTFDLGRLTRYVSGIASGEVTDWPGYDRTLHDPVENAVKITGDVVILEGNYLLLDEPGWRDLRKYADYTVKIEARAEDLGERLILRKTSGGLDRDAALRFVEKSDFYNVKLCLEKSLPADLTLRMERDGGYSVISKGN